MNALDTPVTRIRNVGWKIETGVSGVSDSSAIPCEIAYTNTASDTVVETTSMNAANWSATRVIPNGAVQPPTCITNGPVFDTCSSITSSTISWIANAPTEITRWTWGRRLATRVNPA